MIRYSLTVPLDIKVWHGLPTHTLDIFGSPINCNGASENIQGNLTGLLWSNSWKQNSSINLGNFWVMALNGLMNIQGHHHKAAHHDSTIQWHHNERDGVSNHRRFHVFTKSFVQAQIKIHQSSESLAFVRNSPVTGELPAQRASNAKTVSIWWRHNESLKCCDFCSFNRVYIWEIYAK